MTVCCARDSGVQRASQTPAVCLCRQLLVDLRDEVATRREWTVSPYFAHAYCASMVRLLDALLTKLCDLVPCQLTGLTLVEVAPKHAGLLKVRQTRRHCQNLVSLVRLHIAFSSAHSHCHALQAAREACTLRKLRREHKDKSVQVAELQYFVKSFASSDGSILASDKVMDILHRFINKVT